MDIVKKVHLRALFGVSEEKIGRLKKTLLICKNIVLRILVASTMVSSLFLISSLEASAFLGFIEKKDPLDASEKLEYINIDYWKRYRDDYLVDYIHQALANNHDLKKASWTVEEYRQNMKYSFGAELPSLSTAADYIGLHLSNNFEGIQANQNTNGFAWPFAVNYEPDFLLKNRNKTQSRKSAYEASQYEEKAVYIALISDVATAYVNMLQYDRLIDLQQRVVALKSEDLMRNQKRHTQKTINNNDFNTVMRNFEVEKNSLHDLLKERKQVLTLFALLIGMSPDCIDDIKRGTIENFEYLDKVPDEILSDVIFSRPDVMAAEKKLAKANIDVKVARKELLPSFNINGLWIFNTIATGNFFNWNSVIALILASARQELFMGGRRIANLRINKSKYEQMLEEYKQTDLNAIKEVGDALHIVKQDTLIDNNTIRQLSLERRNHHNSSNMYSQGTISYTDLLNSHTGLLNIEQNRVRTKTTRLVNYFTLYKAVGAKL